MQLIRKESSKENPETPLSFFAPLRESKNGVLRASSRPFADQRKVFFAVLSGPSRIKKRCSSRSFAPLRGSKKGVLSDPSRPFADRSSRKAHSLNQPAATHEVFHDR